MFIIIPRHSSGIRYHHHHHHRKSMITTITLPDWSTQSPRSGPRCCWRPALLCHKDTAQGNQHHDLNQSENSLKQWEVDHSVTDDHRRQERSSCGNSGLFSSLEVGISWTWVLECAELLGFAHPGLSLALTVGGTGGGGRDVLWFSLWHCDTVTLWHCDTVTSWHCGAKTPGHYHTVSRNGHDYQQNKHWLVSFLYLIK